MRPGLLYDECLWVPVAHFGQAVEDHFAASFLQDVIVHVGQRVNNWLYGYDRQYSVLLRREMYVPCNAS